MDYHGIIITGTSGAGKTTIAQKLCDQYEIFQVVQAVTIREPRQNDIQGQYQHITEEEFKRLDKEKKLLVKSEYRGKSYGITHEDFREVINKGKIPVLILTPESVKENIDQYTFLTIFLDASDDILNNRLIQRGEKIDKNTKKQRARDREHAKNCLYTLKNETDQNIADVIQLIYSFWEYRNVGGMLPKKLIELMIKCGSLFENADINKVSGASYDLSLGDQYWQDGERYDLNDKKSFIKLKPGDYVIVSSREIAKFPKDIAGRFDLTVSLFCRGVILSNGPQVDPGFEGGLFCLLFNTSNDDITLKRGEHYATIEFIKLLEPTISYSGKYQSKEDIIDYLPKPSAPSVIVEMKKDIDALKSARWWEKNLPIVLSLLAIVASIVMGVILFFIGK